MLKNICHVDFNVISHSSNLQLESLFAVYRYYDDVISHSCNSWSLCSQSVVTTLMSFLTVVTVGDCSQSVVTTMIIPFSPVRILLAAM